MGQADIPYDRSGMGQGISGIPDATGGLKSMKLDFADAAAAQAPQIPPGAGVPPAGMEGGIPPAGMQGPADLIQGMQGMGGAPQQGGDMQSPLLAGLGGQPQQPMGMDSSMFSDQDLMGMVGDPTDEAGGMMFDQSMQDPAIQQQLLLAAKRQLGGF
jgi:hypothetical protein